MGRALLAFCVGAGSWLQCCGVSDGGQGWLSWGLDSISGGTPESELGASLPIAALPFGVPDGDLEDWLAAIQFLVPDSAIPPITTHFQILFGDVSVEVQIHGLVCQGLRVGSLQPVGAGAATSSGSLAVRAEKVSFTCRASVDYRSSLGLSGSAEASVYTQDAAAGLSAQLLSSDSAGPRVPDSVELGGCSSNLGLHLSIDSGTVWSELTKHIPTLVHRLEGLVSTELDKFVCGAALDGAKQALNGLMRQAHDVAHQYMSAAAPPAPRWDERLVPLQDVPLARWLVRLDEQLQEQPGVYNSLANRLLPGGDWPAIGDSAWAVSGQTCILGGDRDTDCVVAKSLHSDPPADLRIEVEAADVTANISEVKSLEPLNASVSSAGFASTANVHLRFNVSFNGWAGGAEAKGLTSLLGLDLALKAVNASGSMFLGLDRATFEQVPSYRLLPFQCVAPSFHELGFTDLACGFEIEGASLTVLNGTRTSPLLVQAVALVNSALVVLEEYDDVMVAVLNGYLRGNVTQLATEHMNKWASDLRSQACPEVMGEETDSGTHPPLINPPLAMKFMWIALFFATCAGLCTVVHFVQWCAGSLRPPSSRSPRAPGDARLLAARVPGALALTMVLAIVACIFFLAGSNLLQMAQTFVTLETGIGRWGEPSESVRFYQVMVYSTFYSVKKLIEEGGLAKFLAYVIFVLSGVLPYVKLLTMLACWVMPSKLVSARRWRGRALLLMDVIGKFSLADVFVIQFISASMHTVMGISRPTPSGDLPQDPLSLVLRTSQEVGFTAFVLATVGSLIIGHVCLHCHEQDPQVKRELAAVALPQRAEALIRERCSLREVFRHVPNRRRWHVAPVLTVALVLVACGCIIPAFTVTLSSPLGDFSQATYSFYSFAAKLPELAEEPNSFSTRFSQGTFVFFGILSIHAHLVLMLVVWLLKLSPRCLSMANLLGHVLFAYAATDVATMSMVLTLLELCSSDFVPLDDGQQATLGRFAGREIHNPHGLSVDVAQGPGTWFLCAAVFLHWWVGREVMVCLERVVLAQEQASTSLPTRQHARWPSFDSEASINSMRCSPGQHATKADVQRDLLNSPQDQRPKRTFEVSSDAAPGEL